MSAACNEVASMQRRVDMKGPREGFGFQFNFSKALKAVQKGQPISGRDGVLTPLVKRLTEAALEAELTAHLAEEEEPNRRNGKTGRAADIERKIMSLYSRGMSYADIQGELRDMYGISVSTAAVSIITDKVIDEVRQWQQRPLDSHYPILWLDAVHCKVKHHGRYENRAVCTVLGLNMEGRKEVLAQRTDRSIEPGNQGRSHRLRGRTDRLP